MANSVGMLNRLKALTLLSECTGDDLWSVDHCQARGVPEAWVEELADCFESSFRNNSQTIFVQNRPVNHFHGIRDVDLAVKLGAYLGVNVEQLKETTATRARLVSAIRQAVEED